MKKLIFVLLLFALTGCGNNVFQKTCVQTIKSKDITDTETKEVSYNNKDEIINVTIIKSYKNESDSKTLESIKQSTSDFNNALLKKDGIKISVSKATEEEYEVKYYLDV